jgi:hypothetical protein
LRVTEEDTDLMRIAPPAATGGAGPRFEAKVGAFYLLSVLTSGEPRGLAHSVAKSVQFQRAVDERPFDDIVVNAANADGSPAILEVQAKRTIDFTASDPEFADVVRRMWVAAQKKEFDPSRYELAVAIARSSTPIERGCQEVLHWARQHVHEETFDQYVQQRGFASDAMRRFVDAFRHHLETGGAPTDADTVWRLLRRFQILHFDFESAGSSYENTVRERARMALGPDQAGRASDLWLALVDKAQACATAAGEADRATLLRELSEHGFLFETRRDLQAVRKKLSEATRHALDDIKTEIGGIGLPRSGVVEECHRALELNRIVEITCRPGVGKSAVLKHLIQRFEPEGTVVLLSPGRIIGGGWSKMASSIGCDVSRDDLLSELACGGLATLFIDNVDQIDDEGEQITLRDLMRGVAANPLWRAAVTIRPGGEEWRSKLTDEVRALGHGTVVVNEISDEEADVLRAGNPTLAALLRPMHPARAMARNLFHLSRLLDLSSSAQQDTVALAGEIDLARLWWRYGGARDERGRAGRLRILRSLVDQVITRPGVAIYSIDGLNLTDIEALVRADTVREERSGATVAFWHDVLRDWAVGLVLNENLEQIKSLPLTKPVPGTLARGIEIAARLALAEDHTGQRWLVLLATLEADGVHGSWRRPALLALPRSENAEELFDRLQPVLTENNGQRLSEIIRLLIAVESEPLGKVVARTQPGSPILDSVPAGMIVPVGPTWARLVFWIVDHTDSLPPALIPDILQLFQCWLLVTQHWGALNTPIVERLYLWLTEFEQSLQPSREPGQSTVMVIETEEREHLREGIQAAFLMFCHLQPALAERYLTALRADGPRHHDIRKILRFSGSLTMAAPAALVDFTLAALIPQVDPEDFYSQRRRFGPFDIHDTEFVPVSPGQGPFFQLLENAPAEGLRLVHELVEHATNWRREDYAADQSVFPTLPFPGGARTFAGDFGVYQWARGGTGSLIVASALMALEAWGHRQIEAGRPFGDVMSDVLGPNGSSAALVCVAVDLALSHWDRAKDTAWPLLASPELLKFDFVRFTQDASGMGRLFAPEAEPQNWNVRTADLLGRPSRRAQLTEKIGHLALNGPPDLLARVRTALVEARERISREPHPDDDDPIHGLRATAENVVRMADASNWTPETVRLADGREIVAHRYQPPPEELALLRAQQADATAKLVETSARVRLQRALEEPNTSTPEIVARAIQWAKSELARTDQISDDDDNYDARSRERAVVMAAALAARDYDGPDRDEVLAWSQPILHCAAFEESEDLATRTTEHVYSNSGAIGTIGLAEIYCRHLDCAVLKALFTLATRQEPAIVNAIGQYLAKFDQVDERLPRSFVRIILKSAVRPRRTHREPVDRERQASHRLAVAEAIRAERSWLGRQSEEPSWPELPLWPSRRRRGVRLGGWDIDDVQDASQRKPPPDVYVDEHAMAGVIIRLVPFTLGSVHDWVIALSEHLTAWTIEANNGPRDKDDPGDRENRPDVWNRTFFDFLGILSVALPFDRCRALFLEPITQLEEEAFHDASASFLRGFNRATFATDAAEPENPAAVRALLASRLKSGRSWDRMRYFSPFRAEYHLADALNAIFFCQPNFVANARAHVPERWTRLPECMPVLVDLITAAPVPGYTAVIFLNLIDTSPTPTLVPHVISAVTVWCRAAGVDVDFWSATQVGHRTCAWFNAALIEDAQALNATPELRDELVRCLDVMIRSGVTEAQKLEERIVGDAFRLTA